jgi:hypothetical protein
MKNNKRKLKAIVFSMVLAAGMLLPASSFAQEGAKGGMFGRGDLFESDGLFHGLMDAKGDGDPEFDITNDDFDTPLGSGIAILIGAGLGYVALKKKEDEQ